MFRGRRYRLVLVFTFIFGLAVYHFSLLDTPSSHILQTGSKDTLEKVDGGFDHNGHNRIPQSPSALKGVEGDSTKTTGEGSRATLESTTSQGRKSISTPRPDTPTKTNLNTNDPLVGVDSKPTSKPVTQVKIHWTRQPENFPVPTKHIINLPTSKPKLIPQIQAKFGGESEGKPVRLQRLKAVQQAFEHSWKGYKKYAWGHDELAPKTRSHRKKFGGWGATLVDALDTLWIMEMKEEFEEAVEFVQTIDFTYSTKDKIPVFETTIRYFGGLIAAYDVSEGKYPVLLEKAKVLADVLFGIFDTPNRMPVLYYEWKPNKVAIPKQASSRSSLAEIGTLALEFTRLAQITGNQSYFDAIQRITNNLEAIQYDTSLPGMWPIFIDASGGCMPEPGPIKLQKKTWLWGHFNTLMGRAADPAPPPDPACTPYGLKTIPFHDDEYTLGAMSDSFYEYLVKMHILLGGATQQYANLYESSMKVAKRLFWRPMLPDEADVLVSGTTIVRDKVELPRKDTGHLACFTGGMMALGAQALGLKDDLEIGRKLTDGCVHLYGMTQTGVMPEYLELVPCTDTKCKWDEEKWLQSVVPGIEFHPPPPPPPPSPSPSPPKAQAEKHPEGNGAGNEDDDEEDEVSRYKQAEQELAEADEHGHQHQERGDDESPIQKAWRQVRLHRLPQGISVIRDPRYILRPEAIESVYYMYRITGDTKWQEKGWKMFEATKAVAENDVAYCEISDVTRNPKEKNKIQADSMESFWLAETLKYYYLLFAEPNVISLDEWVFNTEAHPFKRTVK